VLASFRRLSTNQEFAMEKEAAQGSAATAQQKLTFKQMSPSQKAVFICKLAISILSFGFIYPNLMSD
jgi:hypothetical protein